MNNNNFTKGFTNSKVTRLVGLGFNQNSDKLGRQTVEEVREKRIRFNQKLENERFFKAKKGDKEINNIVDKKEYLSSLKNLNKE